MKQSFCRLNRLGQCVWCLIAPIWVVSASAGTVTWDGGGTGGAMGYGWQWGTAYPTVWDGDVNPGANDEAVFPALLTGTGITLMSNVSINKLTYAQPGRLALNGAFTITVKDVDVQNNNNIPATNTVTYLQLAGNGIWSVKAPKELSVGTSISNDGNGYSLTKTGDGMLRCTIYESNSYTGKTVVAEGTLRLEGENAQLKSREVIVGDGVHTAMLDVSYATKNLLGVPLSAIVTINTNGLYKISSSAATMTFSSETYIINGGTIDMGGNTINLSDIAATPWTQTMTMTGGVITNGPVTLFNLIGSGYQQFTTKASDKTALITSSLGFSGYRPNLYIEDGAAPIDFECLGPTTGNMTFFKVGPGTMAISSLADSTNYRVSYPVMVNEGTLLIDNARGAGSNSVSVAAGATLGGTGSIYGLNAGGLLGLQGNVTLGGASGNPAILAPGTVDRITGDWLCGTLTVGHASQTNNVTFGSYTSLRVKLARNGNSSRLAVIGAVNLSSALDSDALDIIAPANVPSGEHVLVTFSNVLSGRFDSVTFNGDPPA